MPDEFSNPYFHASEPPSLRGVLRSAPDLTPDDSLGRFLQIARNWPVTELPVLQDGKLLGVVSQEAAIATLAEPSAPARNALLQRPLREFLQSPAAVARPEMTTLEVGLRCAAQGLPQILVVDEAGFCYGIVLYSDLIALERPRPKPDGIGGMATPFGVYLTDGARQAGAGNLALAASGAVMGLLFLLVGTLATFGVDFVERNKFLPAAWLAETPVGAVPVPAAALTAAGIGILTILAFLIAMRLTPLAGYHAAEHQTVHAIERDEPLRAQVVRRMPRPHPRCGTNLMAMGFTFGILLSLFRAIPGLGDEAILPAALITRLAWRRVGTFMQAHFTTRPASAKQLQSGIAAAESLLAQYEQSAPGRVKLARRVWNMGLIQVALGMTAVTLPLSWLLGRLFPRLF